MRKDTIFRIASMSKAVTTVAALILMEEGKLLLSDPVSKYIPSFANTTVRDGPAGTVPAKRPITLRDLMTHTSGISYGEGPAEAQYKSAGAYLWYFADKAEPIGAVVDRIARLPFESQPGEKWIYGFSSDVLGRVVEVASGLPLDVFLKTRIFDPLKMPDTSFFLPPEKRGRLATVYAATESGGIERAPEHGRGGQGEFVDGPRACFSGGAGLLSTANDYARFSRCSPTTAHSRSPAALSQDGRARDLEPCRPALRGGPCGVRPRLPGRRGHRPQRTARISRRVQLGQRLLQRLLGGSPRAHGVPDPGAAHSRPESGPPGQVPRSRGRGGDRPAARAARRQREAGRGGDAALTRSSSS